MLDSDFKQLIRDTLVFLKDPLLPKQTFFTSAEELPFFRAKTFVAAPELKKVPTLPPPLPPVPRPSLTQPQKKEEQVPAAQEAKPQIKVQNPLKTESSEQIKNTLLRMAPHIKLVDEVPNDASAKKIASAWKEKIPEVEVVLLACETNADTLELLKSLGKAIDQNLAKAKIIPAARLEQENRWDLFLQKNQFRLIVASDGMKKLTQLMKFYQAIPAQSQAFLDKIPLLALSASATYKAIENKAHLWKTLCHMLKK